VKILPSVTSVLALLTGVVAAFTVPTAPAPAEQLSGNAWGSVTVRRPAAHRRPTRVARPTTAPTVRVGVAPRIVAPRAGAGYGSPRGLDGLLTAGGPWQRAAPQMVGTYLPDIVTQGNARVRRWGDRTGAPIRVWVAPGAGVAGWRPAFTAALRRAFSTWEQVGLRVRFTFVDAPEDAEVTVTWTDRLDARRAGVTHWTADQDGWVTQVHIVLATSASDGRPANDASMRRIALHEIGHLLGLEHSADPGDVMAAWVHAADLTERDRRTARLLYALPPGEVAADGTAPPVVADRR
jgi:hypothetical protein